MRRHARALTVAVALCALFAILSSASASAAESGAPDLDTCANAAARAEQHAAYLPDCRAYERVTPANKFGYSVGGNLDRELEPNISPDGEAISYTSVFPLGDVNAGSLAALTARRGPQGWSNTGLLPVPETQIGYGLPGYDAYLRGTTPDGRVAVYWDNTSQPYGSLGIRRADGTWHRIVASSVSPFTANPQHTNRGAAPGQAWFQGISDDGRHVVFATSDALVPGIVSSGNDILYEWIDDGSNGGAGTFRVVNRTNAPTPTLIGPANADLGGSAGPTGLPEGRSLYSMQNMRHAISADGSRIFFQSPAPQTNPENEPIDGGPLYLREGGATTTEISAPASGYTPASPPTEYQYLDAAVDGSVVFFWADGDLVSGSDPAGGIYRYRLAGGELTFLDAVPLQEGAGLYETPPTAMASDDGSHLYYESAPEVRLWTSAGIQVVADGQRIRYALEPRFGGFFQSAIGLRSEPKPSADISPDGRYLTFSSTPSEGDLQVYRYDAAAEELTHVSTSPLAPAEYNAGFVGAGARGEASRRMEGRMMSDDGRYVFFDSDAALVAADTNGMNDAYRWDAETGQVALISSGTSPLSSVTQGTDATGANAFFVTAQGLIPSDQDGLYDIYVARIGGGFPEPPPPAECESEACQAVAAAASAVTPGSQTFLGPKNAKPKHRKKAHQKHRGKKAKHKKKQSRRSQVKRANHNSRGSK